jgi:hypothetical protein
MTLEQNRNRPPEPIKGAEARAHRYLADHREERIVPLTVTYAEVIWRKEKNSFSPYRAKWSASMPIAFDWSSDESSDGLKRMRYAERVSCFDQNPVIN